jgi:hypothetical protein
MPRTAHQNRTAAVHVLALLDVAGEDGLTREEIMAGLGLPWKIDWFNAIMRHARRQAATLGRVIPRPTGYVDASRGYQAHCYRLTNLLGAVDGAQGARAGLLVALADTLTRQKTQAATLSVLRSSTALTPLIRKRLVAAHTVAEAEVVRIELLIDQIELVP